MNETTALASVRALFLAVPFVLGGSTMAASHDADPPAALGQESPATASLPMREQMHAMRQQMERMHSASPEERRRLMHEHMAQMERMMDMMHGMMAGQDMMGGDRMEGRSQGMRRGQGMGRDRGTAGGHRTSGGHETSGMTGGAPCPPQAGAHPGNASPRVEMLEERLNVMQLMMDQMLQSQKELLEQTNKGTD